MEHNFGQVTLENSDVTCQFKQNYNGRISKLKKKSEVLNSKPLLLTCLLRHPLVYCYPARVRQLAAQHRFELTSPGIQHSTYMHLVLKLHGPIQPLSNLLGMPLL
jgi:hypothetical protein